ncbi:hypothetical protein [Lacipirellula limnantheis]|uniref:Uncharacterized protein n=1 Tax=Lacipirellula limnantheis TaxID=2528024 RepID=A0A517U2Y5_9BACT|nr:hypothetical protein [Lacipirellula limnantheis]QDT74973.1 hypothetical protein I41_41780 [Lacipirellula limnantheis]
MWCRHCQQDIPAARDHSGPAACSRCMQAFVAAPSGLSPGLKLAALADCGVELEEFDEVARHAAPLRRPKLAGSDDELRRLERMLRPTLRSDFSHGSPLLREPAPLDSIRGEQPFAIQQMLRIAAHQSVEADVAHTPKAAWGVTLLLTLGSLAFFAGVGLLVAANLSGHAFAAQWGLPATLAGEGLLTCGLASLAVRLWRRGRKVDVRLDSIDERLGEVQATMERTVGGEPLWGDNQLRINAAERGASGLGRSALGSNSF